MLINPSNLYSGGNVRLDPTPYLRIALQQKARRQALDEASNQYFSKLPEKLNTAGVRSQDMLDPNGNGGIQTDIEDLQYFWFQNKEGIKKGGMPQQDFMAKFQKVRQKIDESKNRGKLELTIGKEALKPNGWKPREEDHPILESFGLSIYDPKSKKDDGVSEYGINDLSIAAAPYDQNYELKHQKVISSNIDPEKLPDDKGVRNPVTGKVIYNYGYTPEKLRQVGMNASASVFSDRTMRYRYQDLLKDAEQVKIASDALQADYDLTHKDGKKVIVDTPEEMAAGLKMAEFSKVRKPHELNDYEQRLHDQQEAATLAYNRRVQLTKLNDRLIRSRKTASGQEEIEVGFPTEEIANVYGETVDTKEFGKQRVVYTDKVPGGIMRTINPTDMNKMVMPVEPAEIKQPDGTYRKGFYYNEDGSLEGKGKKRIGRDDARDLYIKDRVPTKFKLSAGSAGKITTPSGTTPTKKAKFD